MIPLWKLKRELKRPVDQLHSLVRLPFDIVTKWRHDNSFHARIKLTKGQQPSGQKFAILLIYQPKGLAASTFKTCRHLIENGYSVLLVSNTALTDDARAMLAPVTWQILERPNVGYDFGGYRDGLRILREANVDMQSLVVLNDSIWWPLCDGDRSLQVMEGLGVDFGGMILRPPGKARKRATNRTPHLQSYFFWFGPKVLASEAFNGFWKNYPLSSFKYNTIRQGELRLTKTLLDAGFSVAPLFSFEALMEKLATKPNDYLRKVIHYGAYRFPEMAETAAALEGAETLDDIWRSAAFDLFRTMESRSEFHLALRFACVDLLDLNFLKRSAAEPKDSLHHVGRGKYLEAVRKGDLPAPTPLVLAEIEERHRSGAAAVGR
ncbi:rhamnan synthesis F family protein [Pseudorhodobacter sp. E13]|uniref:rhamnan synthesis F family protein n=1 Tax=Pseudorhodobacter sp. E13 TaxID=2487931 RepID=UPI00131529D5|nr:rhamnan synthesis F family protein [Pseudorhodobacter sp. E13]